ncbi:MAG: dioxygenase [Candidatus Binatia bacterium]
MPDSMMPVGFVAHGAPLLATDAEKGAQLRAWAAAMPRPDAVLVLSAHWEQAPPAIGATTALPLIYDFYGFPKELYAIRYPAPGAPALADRVAALLQSRGPVVREPARGLDHGAWVPLLWMLPAHDVPVLQLSIPTQDPRALVELGRALAPLREEGVLVLASGSLTHNLSTLNWRPNAPVPAWALEFDTWTGDALARGDLDALIDYRTKAPGVHVALPSHEHFVPILIAAGAASAAPGAVRFPVEGFEFGSLSRRCVQFG